MMQKNLQSKSDTGISSKFIVKSFLLISIFVSATGCSLFRATGETIEAVGEGTGTALVGLASGTGHVIAGTGRAISRAAGSTQFGLPEFTAPTNDEELEF